MQLTIAFLATLAFVTAIPTPLELVTFQSLNKDQSLNPDFADQKLIDPVTMAIISGAATEIGAAAAREAISLIQHLGKWKAVREAFTKDTVALMRKKGHPNEAAICCNVGYVVERPHLMRALVDVDLKSGHLHTDYDCFMMHGPNKFELKGDGGFINLAIQPGPCVWSKKTGTLECP